MRKVRKYGSNWGCYYFLSEKKILKRFVKCHVFAQSPPGQHFAPLPICVKMFHSQYYLGKAIPLQAWTGPECSRRMGLPDFKTIDT